MGTTLFVEGYEVDTLGDIDVDFTYSISEISDIEKRNTAYSKTITLPSTPNNQKLFGNIFDISVTNDYYESDPNILVNFNPSKQAKAQVYLDNVKIFDGILRLSKVNNTQGGITYETNLFGRLRDIIQELGDKTLADLDFSDYDHIWEVNNISGSWARTEWTDGGDNYVYPLVDYGLSVDGISYPLKNFKPAVFVREILKRMFAEAGFEIVAPFFNTQYFRKLLLITAEKSITKQVTTILQGESPSFTAYTTSDFYSQAQIFTFSINNGFTNSSGIKFIWNREQTIKTGLHYDGNFKFTAVAGVTFWQAIWTLKVTINGNPIINRSRTISFNSEGEYFNWDVSEDISVELKENDEVEVILVGESLSGDISMEVIGLAQNLKIGNIVPIAFDIQEGDTMEIGDIMPKSMKQRDFLKSIVTMHNLYITQDKLKDNVLEIVPYTLFYRAFKNEALDWTDKLDHSSDIAITPLSELTAKEYRIAFEDDADYWSTFYKTKFNEGYGESRTIVDNDFQLDTKTIKVIFAPPVMREEVAGRVMIHLYKVENNVKVVDNFKARIAYWKPEVPCPTLWTMTYNAGSSSYSAYPYAGHLNDPIEPVNDLLFGTPKEVYFSIAEYPSANLYGAYYEPLISAIGDKNSRLLEGKFYLTPQDIMDLDFRTIIKVGNHYYYLQKIDKYNPIQNTLSSVSLFKILSEVAPLEYEYILLETDYYMLQENGINKFYI